MLYLANRIKSVTLNGIYQHAQLITPAGFLSFLAIIALLSFHLAGSPTLILIVSKLNILAEFLLKSYLTQIIELCIEIL